MPAITLDSVVVASPQQVAALLGDEVVVLGLDAGAYFGLRSVGARIWEQFGQPVRLRDVAERIAAEFDVEAPRCESDLLAFVEALERRHLVEVVREA